MSITPSRGPVAGPTESPCKVQIFQTLFWIIPVVFSSRISPLIPGLTIYCHSLSLLQEQCWTCDNSLARQNAVCLEERHSLWKTHNKPTFFFKIQANLLILFQSSLQDLPRCKTQCLLLDRTIFWQHFLLLKQNKPGYGFSHGTKLQWHYNQHRELARNIPLLCPMVLCHNYFFKIYISHLRSYLVQKLIWKSQVFQIFAFFTRPDYVIYGKRVRDVFFHVLWEYSVTTVKAAIQPTVFISAHYRVLYWKNCFLDDFTGQNICLGIWQRQKYIYVKTSKLSPLRMQ